MDEDDTQHLAGPIAALTVGVVMAAVVMVLAVVTACAVHIELAAAPPPEDVRDQVKRDAMDALRDVSTTQVGDSKDETLSIQTE